MFTMEINSFIVTSLLPSQSPTHTGTVWVGVGDTVSVCEGVGVPVGVWEFVGDAVSVEVGELLGVGVALWVEVGEVVGVAVDGTGCRTTITPAVPPAPGITFASGSLRRTRAWVSRYSPGLAVAAMLTWQV